MGYYLSEWVGAGTRKDPFRPAGTDPAQVWSVIDLRPDASVAAGRCLVWSQDALTGSRVARLADEATGTLGPSLRNLIANRLGLTPAKTRFDEIVADLLLAPPSGKWKALRPDPVSRTFDIYLGGLLWTKQATIGDRGQLIDPADTFNRANETPLASPWVNGSGGGFTAVNLSSNHVVATGDSAAYYTSAAATADQYSQVALSSAGASMGGPAARVSLGGTANMYLYTDLEFGKFVSGAYTSLGATGGTKANPVKIQVSGSSIQVFFNGVAAPNGPKTDTSVTTGQPGFFIYTNSIDDWEGGDLGGGGTELFIAAAVDLSPTIAVALTREQLVAAAADLSPTIAAALSREAILAANVDLSPTVAVALTREQLLAVADDLSPTISVALLLESFIAAAADISPTIAAALTREQLIAAALDASPTIAAALTREQLLAALLDVSPTIDVTLSREALIAAALDLSPTIRVTLTGGTGVALHNLLTLGVG